MKSFEMLTGLAFLALSAANDLTKHVDVLSVSQKPHCVKKARSSDILLAWEHKAGAMIFLEQQDPLAWSNWALIFSSLVQIHTQDIYPLASSPASV